MSVRISEQFVFRYSSSSYRSPGPFLADDMGSLLAATEGLRLDELMMFPVALSTREGLPEGGLTTPLAAMFLFARICYALSPTSFASAAS